ncbi:MAG: hypothetical protein IV100_14825 [Myxococcales bacterium]|nr:hypothetical protein [Myxococcales bacterium]
MITLATTSLFAAGLYAAPPPTFAVQGALQNAGGPVDGSYTLTVGLWSAPEGGSLIHDEVFVAVPVKDGVFSVTLGDAEPIDEPPLAGAVWVGVRVEAEPELPRQPLHPVARAVWAHRALVSESLDCTGCVTESMLSFALPLPLTSIDGLGGGTLTSAVDLAGFELSGFRVENAGAAPVACAPGTSGAVYYDTGRKAFLGCDGASYVILGTASPLGSVNNPAPTCAAILAAAPDSPDGVYYLTAADGTIQAATCDMRNGGWIEVVRWDRENLGDDLNRLASLFTTELNNMGRFELQATYLRYADSNSDADVFSVTRAIPYQNSGAWKLDLRAEHTSFDDSGVWYQFVGESGASAFAACTDAKTLSSGGYSAAESAYYLSGCADSGGYDYGRTYNQVYTGQLASRASLFRLRSMMYDGDGDESRLYRLRIWVK